MADQLVVWALISGLKCGQIWPFKGYKLSFMTCLGQKTI